MPKPLAKPQPPCYNPTTTSKIRETTDMAGRRSGGLKTAAKNKAKDPDYYRKLGAKGGKSSFGPEYRRGGSKASGFATMTPEQVRELGRKGGELSRRGPSKQTAEERYEAQYGETRQPNPAMV